MDGLPPTIHIDELSSQLRWTGSHLLFILTSSPLNSDGRAPTIHIDEPFAATQMDGLPPTTHIDGALPSTQMDELLLFTLASPSLQLRWTGSHPLFILTSSPLNSDGRAPTIHIDEPFAATQMDGLPPTTHIDGALPSTQMDELLLFTLASPSL